jgi:hypothetical protein
VHIKNILEQRYEEFKEVHENPEFVREHRLHL